MMIPLLFNMYLLTKQSWNNRAHKEFHVHTDHNPK